MFRSCLREDVLSPHSDSPKGPGSGAGSDQRHGVQAKSVSMAGGAKEGPNSDSSSSCALALDSYPVQASGIRRTCG